MWATGAKGLVVLRGAGTADRAQQQCKPLSDLLNLVLVASQTDAIWSKRTYRILYGHGPRLRNLKIEAVSMSLQAWAIG